MFRQWIRSVEVEVVEFVVKIQSRGHHQTPPKLEVAPRPHPRTKEGQGVRSKSKEKELYVVFVFDDVRCHGHGLIF
jgi:hypothetical protein